MVMLSPWWCQRRPGIGDVLAAWNGSTTADRAASGRPAGHDPKGSFDLLPRTQSRAGVSACLISAVHV
jgi:hypothetical protein